MMEDNRLEIARNLVRAAEQRMYDAAERWDRAQALADSCGVDYDRESALYVEAVAELRALEAENAV